MKFKFMFLPMLITALLFNSCDSGSKRKRRTLKVKPDSESTETQEQKTPLEKQETVPAEKPEKKDEKTDVSKSNFKFIKKKKSSLAKIIVGDCELSFKLKKSRKISGQIMKVGHQRKGPLRPFCGTFFITSGKTAIELGNAGSKQWKNPEKLSPEARAIIKRDGCPAKYLNKHSENLQIIAASAKLDQVLGATKEKDKVSLKGYNAEIKIMKFKGQKVTANFPHLFLVTKAKINGKKY